MSPSYFLAEDGGHFEKPPIEAFAYLISGKTWVNNHAHVLRGQMGSMDLRFLCRVLENYDVTPWVTGTTRGKLTQAGSRHKIVIPFPPLAEQRRIAEILDKADALRAKRRAALAQVDTLQSMFLDMFGDPVTNPRSWPLNALSDVGTVSGASRNIARGMHLNC